MPKIHLMSGIAGSGKSYLAAFLTDKTDAIYVSSDDIREKWYGDAAIQGDSSAIFTEVRQLSRRALREGTDVVYDATNLTRRRRLHFIHNDVRGYAVTAHVLCPPYSLCLKRNSSRKKPVNSEAIRQMYKHFELPFKEEGYTSVHYYTETRASSVERDKVEQVLKNPVSYQQLFSCLNRLEGFPEIFELPHDTKDHHFSVSRHTFHTLAKVREIYENNPSLKMVWASILHDIGKGATKSFFRFNGEERKYAGYEGHENVSAYLAIRILYSLGYDFSFITSVAKLIQFHHLDEAMSKKTKKQAALIMTKAEQEELFQLQQCNRLAD